MSNPTESPLSVNQMTLAEKIGQMTQVEKNSISPDEVREHFIGSVLSGGGAPPSPNTAAAWAAMVDGYQKGALQTRLAIPLLYGVDAVHGHNNLQGATLFPHNIGLGASRDPELVRRIAQATAQSVVASGIRWNFAPMVAVLNDIRWGRSYECFSSDTQLVTALGAAYLQGLQGGDLADPRHVLGTPKHFIGDGGVRFGSSSTTNQGLLYLMDQGDTVMSEAELRQRFLPPYQAAIQAGARSIMVTHSSWNGTRVLASHHLLTEVLKQELGFQGFLVSDWESVNLIDPDYQRAVVAAINAGVDMVMVPYDFRLFIATLTRAVEQGQVSMARIDDAVRRILSVKQQMGLFQHPYSDPKLGVADSPAHRALAREAVQKSLVLLKNQDHTLPLSRQSGVIQVGGAAANDLGLQSGGWSLSWQGQAGGITSGSTLLEGIRQRAAGQVEYQASGEFQQLAEIGIAVVGEAPYAEGYGDRADLSLSAEDQALIQRMRASSKRLLVIVISGRPLILTPQLANIDALVAAWLPGSEGAGVADVLFGEVPFTGQLPVAWPASMEKLQGDALFPYGFRVGTQ